MMALAFLSAAALALSVVLVARGVYCRSCRSTAARLSAPTPVYVKQIPAGVALDLEVFSEKVVGDVLDMLLDESSGAYDRLAELAEALPEPWATTREDRLPYEELVADITEHVSTRIPLYGTKSLELAELLRTMGLRVQPVHVPGQRGTGGAE